MFFRFIVALTIFTVISISGMKLEKNNLALKRSISEQHYQLQSLEEKRSRLFLKTQQLGAPPRLLRDWNFAEQHVVRQPTSQSHRIKDDPPPPLLQWRLQ